MDIKYCNGVSGEILSEKVYGEGAVEFLYNTKLGRLFWPLLTRPLVSALYGELQSTSLSRFKVLPFVKKYNIDLNDFELNGPADEPYSSFNDFFIRRFRQGKRHFSPREEDFSAPCEARYFGWNKVTRDMTFPVKGAHLTAEGLLGGHSSSHLFEGGPLFIARLCPVDYHRFHYPDSGFVHSKWREKGDLHSVNPLALQYKSDIFIENERVVNILQTDHFGKIAYIEVGATCVGKIVQTHDVTTTFKKGQEKGYFLFGGSTVIVCGEKGKWEISKDIIDNTQKKIETWLPLGQTIASALS